MKKKLEENEKWKRKIKMINKKIIYKKWKIKIKERKIKKQKMKNEKEKKLKTKTEIKNDK